VEEILLRGLENGSEKYRGSGYACQKINVGLQQLMAGNRNFKISTISRNDLIFNRGGSENFRNSLMDAHRESAEKILFA